MFRTLKIWILWVIGRILDIFFTLIKYTLMAAVAVVAMLVVITYAKYVDEQPCWAQPYEYRATIERKVWKSGEQKDRLYLVRLELIQGEVTKHFRAWVTPKQYAEMVEGHILNLRESKGNGLIIPEWGVTIEEL